MITYWLMFFLAASAVIYSSQRPRVAIRFFAGQRVGSPGVEQPHRFAISHGRFSA
jgi:hypothetical protein